MLFATTTILCICAASFYFSPFPIWSTYLLLWKNVIRGSGQRDFKMRMRHVWMLTRYALLTPVWTGLWYLDEVLYGSYKNKVFDKIYVILGQPRSGTTFFHRTLSKDEQNFMSVKHMEWRFPYICVHRFLEWSGLYERVANINYWPKNASGGMANKMHMHILGNYEEDGIFFEERFLHHYFIYRRFPYPDLMRETDYFDGVSDKDLDRILKVHGRVLQKVFYLRGEEGQCPLLKENETVQFMTRLKDFYKEAAFIALLRDPEDSLRSYEMLSKQSTLSKTGIDPEKIYEWYQENMTKREREFEKQKEFFSQEDSQTVKRVRMSFDMVTTQVVDSFEYLYKRLGIHMKDDFKAYLLECEKKQATRNRGYELPDTARIGGESYREFREFVRRSTAPLLSRNVFPKKVVNK